MEEKLQEEFVECTESGRSREERADILEVVDGLALHLGSSYDEVLVLKRSKLQERGGFEQVSLLEWLDD